MELDRGEVALSVRVPARDTDPRTEVGQVGASLNRMLGHVSAALTARQASEVRVRKFVADASHELRTPLAAIRGYAELTRRVSDGALPDDVTYAMSRVESESARMTTLVEDLLLLARLDAGRPLDHSAVDLSASSSTWSATPTWPAASTTGTSTFRRAGHRARRRTAPASGDREPAPAPPPAPA
jgi:two-component system OmpR family sensor kinase